MTGKVRSWLSFDVPIPKPDFDVWREISGPPSPPTRCYSQTKEAPNRYELRDVTPAQLRDLLVNPSDDGESVVIIDVRFSYEHKGRIPGSRNMTRWSELVDFYNRYKDQDVFVIFHCEFSRDRGPHVMHKFREYDRNLHMSEYPNLGFKKVGLLVGGYREFHRQFPELCLGGYVRMLDKEHVANGDLKRAKRLFVEEMGDPRSGGEPKGKIRRCLSALPTLGAMGEPVLEDCTISISASQPL